MKRALGVAIVLGAFALIVVPRALAYYSSTWFDGADGHASAVRQSKTMHAPMLVYFRVDWCPHCRAFDALLDDSQVRSRLAGVIKVRMNPESGDGEKTLFEKDYGGKGYPSIYLVPADGGAPRKISHRGPAETFLAQLD